MHYQLKVLSIIFFVGSGGGWGSAVDWIINFHNSWYLKFLNWKEEKNAFSICNENYPCSYLLGHELEIFGHFLLCHFVWADGNCLWYRWKHCKSWSNYMHIQSNLLIFNLMGLTERLTYLKILDIQLKIYQLPL